MKPRLRHFTPFLKFTDLNQNLSNSVILSNCFLFLPPPIMLPATYRKPKNPTTRTTTTSPFILRRQQMLRRLAYHTRFSSPKDLLLQALMCNLIDIRPRDTRISIKAILQKNGSPFLHQSLERRRRRVCWAARASGALRRTSLRGPESYHFTSNLLF